MTTDPTSPKPAGSSSFSSFEKVLGSIKEKAVKFGRDVQQLFSGGSQTSKIDQLADMFFGKTSETQSSETEYTIGGKRGG